ncbi:helix-turn-helix transcriptional regulator [uncultured Dokdonia sp.]|uniref:helix-turn-helix domain-containing protein n=1 Tax=uncultured Dokdonia sp. TaxID=575653 RepID=UPI00260E822C|nr:helix-turn-helix transcriptional regulator [uncultured Dokdonia sp.]
MNKTLHYLKTYRERSGIALGDMAEMIGIDIGSLSKIEKGKRIPQINTVLSYHFILRIPIERLLKQHYTEILQNNISQATTLKDRLLEAMTSPDVSDRITNIDTIIDQLIELQGKYGK